MTTDPEPSARAGGAPFPPRWLGLLIPAYAVHLLDERLTGAGVAEWSTRVFSVTFTDEAWLAVNLPSFALLALATWRSARGAWPSWVAVALATHVGLHGALHAGASAWAGAASPGLWSGLLVCLPLGALVWIRARAHLPPRRLALGLGAGALSFQPLWHAALLPFLA